MTGLLKQVFKIYTDYMGKGIAMWLFLAAILYLWIVEKNKSKKTIFIYASVALLILFFFPLSSYLLIHTIFDGEVYYRILWLLPMGVTIAYALIRFIDRIPSQIGKGIASAIACMVIAIGGNYIYANPTFTKAENLYQLPQAVIEICDAIEVEDQWVRAAMPQELLNCVRQYSADVRMPYGRENLIARWNFNHPMMETMEAPVINAKKLAEQGREYWCYYLVIGDNREMSGKLEDYDYIPIGKVGYYTIYVDSRLDKLNYRMLK